MMHSVKPKDGRHVKGYEFLSFVGSYVENTDKSFLVNRKNMLQMLLKLLQKEQCKTQQIQMVLM